MLRVPCFQHYQNSNENKLLSRKAGKGEQKLFRCNKNQFSVMENRNNRKNLQQCDTNIVTPKKN